ncbi:hypothetical protein WJX84_011544 [Apatococcus fuscideae]|uniref:Uncharacterized protein n=1 Tax=Apatococcus fuscideae TaxID=2026836 RepID=A0AAW1T0H0_9CHLO
MADRPTGAGRPGKSLDKDGFAGIPPFWLKVIGGTAAAAVAGYAILRYTGKDSDVEHEANKASSKVKREGNKLFH